MFCHGPDADDAYAVVLSDMESPFSRPLLRGLRPVVPASRLRQGRSVAPVPPPARLGSGTLFPRVSRARARARYAAARFARLIAPARARAKRGAPPSASTSTSTIRPAGGGGGAPEPDPAGGQDCALRAGEAPPPARLCSGTLFRAYRVRAWPRAYRGGANRAPDCACAREAKRRAHLSRQLRRGSFSRRRETGGEAAPRTPFPSTRPRVSRISRCQSLAANASGGAGGCLRRQPEPPGGSSRAGRRLRPRPRLP